MAADRTRRCALLALIAMIAAVGEARAELEPAPTELVAEQIAARSEAAMRGRRRVFDAGMTFWQDGRMGKRTIRFRATDDSSVGRALIRLLAPEEEVGRALLKLPPNVWAWVPKEGRISRLPTEQWHAPCLDGAFDNDDLLHLSDRIGDYDHRLLGIDPQPDGLVGLRAYVVESRRISTTDRGSARIVTWVETEHATPLRREVYGADGALARVLRFGDIREVQGRRFPHVWTARRTAWKGHETRLEVEKVWFDPKLEPGIFDPQRLRPPE